MKSGKNQVGAFHQPALVLCDIDLLSSLPPREFLCGCAEVIKTAILFDRRVFAHLQANGTDFDRTYVITRCIECKRDVVCEDEFDTGRRQLLNLGHTVAHAIEKLTDYIIPHGEAVAIGCAIFARAFASDAEQIEQLFSQFSLPLTTEFSAPTLANAALSDKKRLGDSITLVVPHCVGNCSLRTYSVEELEDIIKAGL